MKNIALLRLMLATMAALLLGQITASAKIPPADAFARMPVFYDAAISPDGRWIAAIANHKGDYIVRFFNIADPTDKKVRATGLGKGVKPHYIVWSGNKAALVRVSNLVRREGTPFHMNVLWNVPLDGSTPKRLLRPTKEFQGYQNNFSKVIDFLPNDPDHLLMGFDTLRHGKTNVVKKNIWKTGYDVIRNGSIYAQHFVTDTNNNLRIAQGRKSSSEEYFMEILPTVGGEWDPVQEFPGLVGSTPIFGFTANPNEMIIGSHRGKDTLGAYIYNLNQKKITRKIFHDPVYDIDSIVYTHDGKKPIGVRYTAQSAKTLYFDPIYKARWDKILADMDGFDVRVVDQSRDGRKILVRVSAPSVPSSMQLYDVKTGNYTLLGQNYPELESVTQADVITAKYTARDGTKIPAYVTLPAKIADGLPLKNLPFVLLPHGGPFARDSKSYDYLAQFIASRGYGVLQMDFRGSTGYGRTYSATGRDNWVVMQNDVEDAARWIIKKGYADPDRVCIAGWSYGGYAALMAAAKNPDLYACAASIAGLTAPVGFMQDQKDYVGGRISARNFILRGFENGSKIKENSPVHRAADIKAPVFLAHGTDDSVVRFSQFKRMKSALKKSGGRHTFVEIKDGDHGLAKTAHRTKMITALDKFLQTHLGTSIAAP